ncbi:S26 family signal peptidase [Sphingomonas paeninsulae]|uniref:S26 family signal peptidase n=1 Tax=Sphingomonas paeninsulae TaxID=2319844 RepID=UPI0013CF08F5|nr:S26 family signal peptidase [Sphingomonas paeninsulae]
MIGIGLGIAAVVATIVDHPRPRLVWNASASAPVGLYAVTAITTPRRGDLVIAWPPSTMRDLAARRHYLPRGVPLVKRIVAVSGDRICAGGDAISIDDRLVAIRRSRDAQGRSMPQWTGCITLHRGTVFLLMTKAAGSFDGRYFGPTGPQDLIGKATPLWVR